MIDVPERYSVDLGYCIYCPDGKGELTHEHVLPHGLKGQLILEHACCSACKALIDGFEGKLLKWGWLGDARLVLEMPSYKRKRQRTVLSMTFYRANGTRVTVDVDKKEAITVLYMPMLLSPRALSGVNALSASDGAEVVGEVSKSFHGIAYKGKIYSLDYAVPGIIRRAVSRLGAPHGANRVDLSIPVTISDVARFLCKVAYGMYVAVYGVPAREDSPALAIMLGKRTDVSNWVGSEPVRAAGEDDLLHRAWIDERELDGLGRCSIVNLALFNSSGLSFAYSIVVHAPGWASVAPDTVPLDGGKRLEPIHVYSMA